jgi:predicted PurR-regulated permease PerM
LNSFSQLLTNFPTLVLQIFVGSFIFYYFLRDGEEFIGYLKSLMPFSKDTEKKIFLYTKEITFSVIYGQVIVGILQGIIVGISLFMFGVPNALLLTIFTIFVSILPIVGPFIVWIPTMIYLLSQGNTTGALGIAIFGLIASSVDNILRPLIVSRRTKLHSALVLTGMVGGLFIFGVLGLIIGPLILAYLLIVLEVYRNKKISGVLIQENNKSS